ELGVVCEELRNRLRSNIKAPGGKLFSLRFSQGEYSLTGEYNGRRLKPCTVVGVLLDQECSVLSFFDVEEKCLLDYLNFDFPGSLYPFFSPGSDGKWLGVRRV
ncbi:ERMAP protein, partial [Ramphastos sulfuratus]|nr:ERMAP protein [Ramphastos sulfuratus]